MCVNGEYVYGILNAYQFQILGWMWKAKTCFVVYETMQRLDKCSIGQKEKQKCKYCWAQISQINVLSALLNGFEELVL